MSSGILQLDKTQRSIKTVSQDIVSMKKLLIKWMSKFYSDATLKKIYMVLLKPRNIESLCQFIKQKLE